MTFQAPPGIKNNMLKTYTLWTPEFLGGLNPFPCQVLFILAWFHAILQERRGYTGAVSSIDGQILGRNILGVCLIGRSIHPLKDTPFPPSHLPGIRGWTREERDINVNVRIQKKRPASSLKVGSSSTSSVPLT